MNRGYLVNFNLNAVWRPNTVLQAVWDLTLYWRFWGISGHVIWPTEGFVRSYTMCFPEELKCSKMYSGKDGCVSRAPIRMHHGSCICDLAHAINGRYVGV